MNGRGKSDRPIDTVETLEQREVRVLPAEGVEGRGLTEGNPFEPNKRRTQAGRGVNMEPPKRARSGKPRIRPRGDTWVDPSGLPSALERIRQAAGRDKKLRFTGLWHHVYAVDRLRTAYFRLKKEAAPGVDGETWRHYGENLEENLQDLSGRLKRGAYRAKPVRRAYIPKADGRQRPLGVTVLEDKVVQRATAEVMNAVYEEDFLGFSYGFRPGRRPHDALDALYAGIMTRPVSWVLDADIRGYFDAIDHEWLVKFVEHRIADKRVIRHVIKWLKAGVLEDGMRTQSDEGVPQGGSISPLLANIYLHYVFDLWADCWRRKYARGNVVVVRFADDFVVGFQYREDAERFRGELRERFGKFNLALQDDKTRLIEFGRFAAGNRQRAGRRQAGELCLSWVPACMRSDPKGEVHRASADFAEEDAGQAEGNQNRASAATA